MFLLRNWVMANFRRSIDQVNLSIQHFIENAFSDFFSQAANEVFTRVRITQRIVFLSRENRLKFKTSESSLILFVNPIWFLRMLFCIIFDICQCRYREKNNIPGDFIWIPSGNWASFVPLEKHRHILSSTDKLKTDYYIFFVYLMDIKFRVFFNIK